MKTVDEIMDCVEKYGVSAGAYICKPHIPSLWNIANGDYETVKSAIEELATDAEQWRKYRTRKDAVIAAGMGRNPLREE